MIELEQEDGGTILWPKCPIVGCINGICKALNSDYCHPHTPGASEPECQCGARSVGSSVHADYCDIA